MTVSTAPAAKTHRTDRHLGTLIGFAGRDAAREISSREGKAGGDQLLTATFGQSWRAAPNSVIEGAGGDLLVVEFDSGRLVRFDDGRVVTQSLREPYALTRSDGAV